MMIRFLKNWTLPVAMCVGCAFYLLFAYVPWLEEAGTFFAPLMEASLPVFMFLVLVVTFCKVEFRQLRAVRWHAWVLILHLVLVALCLGIILLLKVEGNQLVLTESLLMCIIAPTAMASAVVTQKLGGSLEQTTTFIFLSNMVTALLVSLCFPLIEKQADLSFLAAFLHILWQVVILLLAPMLLAYIVKHRFPRLHSRIIAVHDLSFYLWACCLSVVTGITVRNIVHAKASVALLTMIALIALVSCLLQFALGRFVGHFFGRTQEAGQVLGQKNTSFAIWLAHTYLNPLATVGPGCYILWQNIVNSIEIWQKRNDNLNANLRSSSAGLLLKGRKNLNANVNDNLNDNLNANLNEDENEVNGGG